MFMKEAIEVEGLVKAYGDKTVLDGLSISVPEGSVTGLLGPNGAGKTTAISAIVGLTRPDAGTVSVLGMNPLQSPYAVRKQSGFAGQYSSVDDDLTTLENLTLICRLYGMSRSDAKVRATNLIEQFDMGSFADKRAAEHSGGMRRRLDLSCALASAPRVLFLDEPTTGLDPKSRRGLWEVIDSLVKDEGTTLLLTTQYLEEADRLADQVEIIRDGRLVASGTPQRLKDEVGPAEIRIRVAQTDHRQTALVHLADLGDVSADANDPQTVTFHTTQTAMVGTCVVRLEEAGVPVAAVDIKEPTLNDVFFALTDDVGTTAQVANQ